MIQFLSIERESKEVDDYKIVWESKNEFLLKVAYSIDNLIYEGKEIISVNYIGENRVDIYYNIKPNKISDKQSLDRKIITICGSNKFTDIIELEAIKLSLKGNIVLTPVLHIMDNINKLSLPDEDVSNLLEKIHKTKIEMSDIIYVVNYNNYIGESTKKEIDYAKLLGKLIIYME